MISELKRKTEEKRVTHGDVQEIYDVPPVSPITRRPVPAPPRPMTSPRSKVSLNNTLNEAHISDSPTSDEVYDVPPPRNINIGVTQDEVYDVPPARNSVTNQPRNSGFYPAPPADELYDTPPPRSEYTASGEEIYDVPPPEELYDVPPTEELYDVPPSSKEALVEDDVYDVVSPLREAPHFSSQQDVSNSSDRMSYPNVATRNLIEAARMGKRFSEPALSLCKCYLLSTSLYDKLM